MKTHAIELLEPRIAPASLTFADVDGDSVLITTTGPGTLTLGGNVIVTPLPGAQTQIVTLDLTDAAFQGASVSIIATRDPLVGGDGFVNIGSIDAGGRDLGKVLVDGDLGQLFAGSGTDPKLGVASLDVASLGRFGTTTGAPGLAVNIDGKIGTLKVKGDVRETLIIADSFGAITIGGSLIGGTDQDTGKISSAGAIGPVKIGGDIRGGGGLTSGAISASGGLAALTVGGSILGGTNISAGTVSSTGAMGPVKIGGSLEGGGGTGIGSGSISSQSTLASLTIGGSVIGSQQGTAEIRFTGAIGPVKIGGDVKGGGMSTSGRISTQGTLASITIGGSLIGGGGENTGEVFSGSSIGLVKIGGSIVGGDRSNSGIVGATTRIAGITVGGSLVGSPGTTGTDQSKLGVISCDGVLGPVKILGNIQGGDVSGAVTFTDSGAITAGRVASVFVGGSILGGKVSGGGTLINSGGIHAANDLGAITVKGSIIGQPGAPLVIMARGQLTPGATTDLAIKGITIGGRVERTDILAGYTGGAPMAVNADAQIGNVVVGGDWFTSNLVAGVQDNATPARDDFFGEGDDQAIVGGSDKIVSKIASITIKGYAFGTVRVNQGTGIDHFGFVAQQIGAFKVGGTSFPLTSEAGNDLGGLLVGATGDLRVREITI